MTQSIHFGTDGVRGWRASGRSIGRRRAGRRGIGSWTRGGRVPLGETHARAARPGTPYRRIRPAVRKSGPGVLPTAAVSAAVDADPEAAAGVMITASHNPAHDNGIKVVGAHGEKLTDRPPLLAAMKAPTLRCGGRARSHPSPLDPWLARLPTVDLRGRKILLDAAHGAGRRPAESPSRPAEQRSSASAHHPMGSISMMGWALWPRQRTSSIRVRHLPGWRC